MGKKTTKETPPPLQPQTNQHHQKAKPKQKTQQTGNCRDACEAEGWCQSITAGSSDGFTEERSKGLPCTA